MRFRYILGLIMMSGLMPPLVTTADESSSLMTFSTVGPDCYADGTTVLDGEYYALVYQTEAAGEISFTLAGEIDGDSSNAVLLRALPRAKDGHCRLTTFSIDSAALPKLSAAGVLRLYLLDTRVYANGVATVGGLKTVQASVPVTATCKVTTGSASGAVCGTFAKSALAGETPNPKITGIALENGLVRITVADTIDGVNYTVIDPFEVDSEVSTTATGKTGATIVLRMPCSPTGSGFFRVTRK